MNELLNYFIRDFQGIKVVELSGNLNVNTGKALQNLIENIIRKESIMVNLENVNLISSTGLSLLIDLSFLAKSVGKRLILLWPSEEFTRMAESLDVYNYLIFAQSLEEGQTKIRFFT